MGENPEIISKGYLSLFAAKAGDTTFALAHNGVLSNDKRLRRQHNLPATRIETVSYIAVQLLEASEALSFASLASMAEKLEGSFTITVMTDQDELYFVKGDNHICIYHFEKLGVYIYASTEPILKSALKQLKHQYVYNDFGRYGKSFLANLEEIFHI